MAELHCAEQNIHIDTLGFQKVDTLLTFRRSIVGVCSDGRPIFILIFRLVFLNTQTTHTVSNLCATVLYKLCTMF